jgi:ASC-1-like (ASCH) protein
MLHEMRLEGKGGEFFEKVKSGAKTIELRLWDEKRRKILPGDKVVFSCGEEKVEVEVKGLFVFGTFEDLFRNINIKDAGLDNAEEALTEIQKLYPAEKQNEAGVVGIMIEKK